MGPPRVILGSLAVGLAVASAAGCTTLSGFSCSDDAQCERDDDRGVCDAVGFCAYPDPGCPSGTRFSPDAAEPFANTCTDPGAPPPIGTTDGGSTTEDDPASTSAASEDTGPPLPVCGNGIPEGDEPCDDGNDVVGDGCNPDCRPSGTLVASLTSQVPGIDLPRAVAPIGEDAVIIAGEGEPREGNRDIMVARFGLDAGGDWVRFTDGSAHGADRARTLVLTEGGTVVVAGEIRPDEAPTAPRSDIWLSELGIGDGEPVWEATDGAPAPSHDAAMAMVRLAGGDLVVAGRVDTLASADFLVRRYAVVDNGVDTVWSKTVNGMADTSDWASALVQDDQGRLWAGGARHATSSDVDHYLQIFDPRMGDPSTPPCDDGSTADGRVAEGDDRILGLAVAPSGHVAAVGHAAKTPTEGLDAWIGWYSPDTCNLVWTKTWTGAAQLDDAANAVVVDTHEQIVTVGHLRETNGADLWVAKWDATGTQLWQAPLLNGPGDGTDTALAVALTEGGDIVVAGQLSTPGSYDTWVGWYTP